jgi:hypothetical protein
MSSYIFISELSQFPSMYNPQFESLFARYNLADPSALQPQLCKLDVLGVRDLSPVGVSDMALQSLKVLASSQVNLACPCYGE